MRPSVIVHHLAQAKVALSAADTAGADIQLWSAPGAATFAGVGFLKALGDAVDHELLIDCGDDAGLVMAALRTGCKTLFFRGSEDERLRLSQMAGRSGALLYGPEDRTQSCLLLSADDDGDSIHAWLDAINVP